jgi:hypothetical protein
VRRPAGLGPVLWFLSFAFTFFVATASNALAAEVGGVVRVHVATAASQDVSAAVVVTMSSATVPGRTWTASVDPGCVATFRNVPPATYRVSAGPDGGKNISIDVTIAAGGVADLVARFSSHVSSLEITTLSRVAHGVTFSAPMLTGAPAQSVAGLLDTAEPFVIVDRMDNGGLLTGQSALVGSRGSSWTNLTMSMGDVEVIGPNQTGRAGLVPSLTGLDAVVVTTGLAPVDFGSPGADVALVPKRPGSESHGQVGAATTTGRMAGRNDTPAVPSI